MKIHLGEDERQGKVFSQWDGESHSGHVKPGRNNAFYFCKQNSITAVGERDGKPVDNCIDGGEDSSEPSAREGPAEN